MSKNKFVVTEPVNQKNGKIITEVSAYPMQVDINSPKFQQGKLFYAIWDPGADICMMSEMAAKELGFIIDLKKVTCVVDINDNEEWRPYVEGQIEIIGILKNEAHGKAFTHPKIIVMKNSKLIGQGISHSPIQVDFILAMNFIMQGDFTIRHNNGQPIFGWRYPPD